MLVRSWNVFHGNTLPPGRRSHLEEMIRLATADRPDVLCLQEVPLWSLSQLPHWSGMTERHVVTRKGPLGVWLGGVITRLNNGFFRSRLAGQANAILLAPGLEPTEHHSLRIDERLPEPRYCHAVKLDRLVVGNLHATSDIRRPEVPASEIVRAEAFVDRDRGRPSVRARRRLQPSCAAPARAPWLVGARAGYRPCARARAGGLAARQLAARASPPEWRRALRSRSRRGHGRMTPAEARALFPVLEHVAYLNAGTFGPLARPTIDAVQQLLQTDLERGRVGKPYFDRLLQLRADVRAALCRAGRRGAGARLADGLDDGRLQHRSGRPWPRAGRRDRHHPRGAFRTDRAGARERRPASWSSMPIRTQSLPRSHRAPACLPFARPLDERSSAPGARAARALGVPILVDGAQSVGAIPVDAERPRLPDDLRPEMAVRAGCHRRARRLRPGAAARRAAELLLAVRIRTVGKLRAAVGAARFDPGWIPTAASWAS